MGNAKRIAARIASEQFDIRKLAEWASGMHGQLHKLDGVEEMREDIQVRLLEECSISPAQIEDAMHELRTSPAGKDDWVQAVSQFVAQLYGPTD